MSERVRVSNWQRTTHWEREIMVAVVEELTGTGVAPVNLSEAGSWLCSRHSELRDLVQRVPGAWQDGAPVLWKVRDALVAWDDNPGIELDTSHALAVMSPGEVGRLRLLATLAPASAWGNDARWCVESLGSFNAVGKELVYDWLRCIRVGVIG